MSTTHPTTPLDNIELDVMQVVEATGVPESAVRRLCTEGRVPCRNIGKGNAAYWRIRTGDLQAVRDAHAAMLTEGEERRRAAAAQGGRARPYAVLAARVDALEAFLAESFGYTPPAPADGTTTTTGETE